MPSWITPKSVLVVIFIIPKITDPKLFYESVGNITAAQSRLDDVVDSAVRKIITRNLLTEAVRNSNVISTIKRSSPYQKAGADKGEKPVALGIDTSVVYRDIKKGRATLSQEMFSETIKGEADRKAAAIYTAAYASEPDFYEFWKAVESYRALLPNFRKTLTTQPAYFKYLYDKNGK